MIQNFFFVKSLMFRIHPIVSETNITLIIVPSPMTPNGLMPLDHQFEEPM
jgi:hypothetical protein